MIKNPLTVLKEKWGYEDFRENQLEAINALIEGDTDILYIAKTSSGKSLVYQIPILCMESGTALVVSPLLSLMSDQVKALQDRGIRAYEYNSTLGVRAKRAILEKAKTDEIDLLYAAPETILNPEFLEFIQNDMDIKYLALDESHCISSYGSDFRPKYKQIKSLRAILDVPCIALTATADKHTEEDIKETLRLGNTGFKYLELKQYLDRPSIFYNSIIKNKNPKKQVLDIIKQFDRGTTGIVYCTTIKACEDIASFLYRQGYKAKPYFAKMKVKDKEQILSDWLENKLDIVVATSAFGMGIDHPSVRYVICFNMPSSIEDLLQAVGRASRDGKPSQAYILYDNSDVNLWKFMINKTANHANKTTKLQKLSDVTNLVRTRACIRKKMIEYFDQEYDKNNCQSCSNCIKFKPK